MLTTARIPLLKDHHSHPYLYATLAHCLDLRHVAFKDKAMELIEQRCGSPNSLTIVMGWDDSRYLFSEAELNDLPPVVILNTSLHFLVMNRAALERISPRFPELTDNRGDRAWIEHNCGRLLEFMMNLTAGDAGRLRSFFDGLACQGVWYVEEMSLAGPEEITCCDAAGLGDRTSFWAAPVTCEELEAIRPGRIRGIKLFTDGALGARTARLSLPYRDGGTGILVYDNEQLATEIQRGAFRGKDVAIHAIGDDAIHQTLDAIDSLTQRPSLIRIEHAQFISLSSALRAKDLGISLCMQPNFSGESLGYADRLPEGFRARNNPFRMLIDQAGFVPGKDLLFGSDGMPHGVRSALESALFPPFPGQRLALDEFIAGYCMPDLRNGHLDINIDHAAQRVAVSVTINADRT